jgi:3-oxoadipate enol-lactonase
MELVDNRCNEEWRRANPEKYKETFEFWEKYFTRGSDDPETETGSKRQLEARKSHDTFNRLNNITCPVFICGGKYDGIAPLENQRNLNERIPNSKLELFEGGHGFLGQDPKAYKKIIKFLQS